MSTSTYQERLEASVDAWEWQARITRCPWAFSLQELIGVAMSAVDDWGKVAQNLFFFSEQLETAMKRKNDVDVESARLVLDVVWEAEMEREARIARRGW